MPVTSNTPETSTFDYIIVGSGAGGGPLAARLARAGCRVLLIEAGGNSADLRSGLNHEVSLVPSLHAVSTEHPDLSWRFFVKHYQNPPAGQDPKWHTANRQAGEDDSHEGIFYPRAAAVGGCTIHNAMITIAGPDGDWDDLADYLKDDSWRGSRMRTYYQRIERNEYMDSPTPVPSGVWGQAWEDLRWLFGYEPDHTRGGHGFGGWLHTSVADVSLGLRDKQLIKILKAALIQSKKVGLERASTLVRRFLKGQIQQGLDPNHARTQAESPEGLVLIPISVCGDRTTIHQNRQTPYVMRGRRSSPRELLLEVQASHSEHLTIGTDCLVTRVLFADGPLRVVGVEFRNGKRLYKAHPQPATDAGEQGRVFVKPGGEVVLCGGSFNTPQLLMLSGIGHAAHLDQVDQETNDQDESDEPPDKKDQKNKKQKKHPPACCLYDQNGKPMLVDGQPRRIHSPGVGNNLQDRYEVTVISELKRDFSLLRDATFELPAGGQPPDTHLAEWREHGTGLYTSNGAVLGIFKRSQPDLAQPDLFIFGIPLPFKGYQVGYSNVGNQHNFFTWTILKAHTRNHDGVVRLRSADPLDTPLINFHYFNERSRPGQTGNDADLEAIVEGVKFVREIAEHARLVIRQEHHPGYTEVTADNVGQIKNWIRREAWGHHACGTCRMGPPGDECAVLDNRFRVLGETTANGQRAPIAGLRVVDASIFPNIPGYFIVTNIYMASEKAADQLLADRSDEPPCSSSYPNELHAAETAALSTRRVHRSPEPAPAVAESTEPSTLWADDVTGLALSGGGIRSATICLGLLQALAQNRLLRRIDFLSTVSGGGYIGSFLGRCFDRLRLEGRNVPAGTAVEALAERVEEELSDADSPLIDWLRKHGNYIAPKGKGDWWVGAALFVRNLLSVHFVVGVLLFALFGLANALRYGIFDPASTGLNLVLMEKGDLPLGQFLESALGPFFSPWFIVAELVLLFMVLPRLVGYWIVSADRHQGFHPVALTLLFLVAGVHLFLGVRDGLWTQPLVVGVALLTSFIPVERAWRRGRRREEAVGSGGEESQRARTRNFLTYDLGLMLGLAAAALVFAVVDTIGHGLQQKVIAQNISYIKAFAAIGAALAAAIPVVRIAANLFLAGQQQSAGPPSTMQRILRKQVVAGLIAVVLFSLPLVFYSFAAHAVYQGGSALAVGIGATVLAVVVSILLRFPSATTFVNRSSLAQLYAARLARAYLGASNPNRRRPDGANVTEVIAGDDVSALRAYQPHAAGGPIHLINVAVNQTVDFTSQRGNRDRQAENLAVSWFGLSIGKHCHGRWTDPPGTHSGSSRRWVRLEPVGYRPGAEHPLIDETGEPTNRAEQLSLRQWMAISGAAVGPSRGGTTELGTALLFGLANLRTGYWWDSGITEVARDGFPQLTFLRRLMYLVPRFFRTQSMLIYEWIAHYRGPWERFWNLSDGGFFENTGGYELIRRRVPRIIVCDASADPDYRMDCFADLTRKVWIDFGASICAFTSSEIKTNVPASLLPHIGTPDELAPQPPPAGSTARNSAKHAALYWVHYPGEVRRSVLLYVKATVTGDEGTGIGNYHSSHPEFPHESTGDQFFDEAQWESYRKLGQHMASPLWDNPAWFWALPLPPSLRR